MGSPRRRVVLVAVLLAAALGIVSAVAAATGHVPGDDRAGFVRVPGAEEGSWTQVQLPRTRAGRSYSFGGPRLCLDGGATEATIESVDLVDPKGGLAIRHFSVHELDQSFEPGSLGAEARSLSDLGWPIGSPHLLATSCFGSTKTGAGEGTAGLAVEVVKPADATAGASGLRVHWRIGEHRGATLIPFAMGLCEGDEDHCTDFVPADA